MKPLTCAKCGHDRKDHNDPMVVQCGGCLRAKAKQPCVTFHYPKPRKA